MILRAYNALYNPQNWVYEKGTEPELGLVDESDKSYLGAPFVNQEPGNSRLHLLSQWISYSENQSIFLNLCLLRLLS